MDSFHLFYKSVGNLKSCHRSESVRNLRVTSVGYRLSFPRQSFHRISWFSIFFLNSSRNVLFRQSGFLHPLRMEEQFPITISRRTPKSPPESVNPQLLEFSWDRLHWIPFWIQMFRSVLSFFLYRLGMLITLQHVIDTNLWCLHWETLY